MRSEERRRFARLVAVLRLAALGACGGDPPPAAGAATWDQGVWGTSTSEP